MTVRPISGQDLDDRLPATKCPHELVRWVDEESHRRAVGRGILVSVALARLAADLEAYGDVELLWPGPRDPSPCSTLDLSLADDEPQRGP